MLLVIIQSQALSGWACDLKLAVGSRGEIKVRRLREAEKTCQKQLAFRALPPQVAGVIAPRVYLDSPRFVI